MQLAGTTGPSGPAAAGTALNFRQGATGEIVMSELNGRLYEQTARGNTYSTSLTTVTSIANATFSYGNGSSATLATAAASTPILGVWNNSSTTNLVLLQATLQTIFTATTATTAQPFTWVVFAPTNTLTNGSAATPLNRKTMLASGSIAKGYCGLALTGLANVMSAGANFTSALGGGVQISGSQTVTVAPASGNWVENFDGSLIVPPGAVLGLFSNTTPVAVSAAGTLLWAEVSTTL